MMASRSHVCQVWEGRYALALDGVAGLMVVLMAARARSMRAGLQDIQVVGEFHGGVELEGELFGIDVLG